MFTGIPFEVASKAPRNQVDYDNIANYIKICRAEWIRELMRGRNELTKRLEKAGVLILTGEERSNALRGRRPLLSGVVVTSRLKDARAIVAKMQRFGESLASMLDVWGYRVMVNNELRLEDAVLVLQGLWEAPTKDELLLRQGALQFEWLRDYRKRSHAGLSDATSLRYDQAIHMNRRAPFGICEIQIMTEDLYQRAFLQTRTDEAHIRFARRRELLTRQG